MLIKQAFQKANNLAGLPAINTVVDHFHPGQQGYPIGVGGCYLESRSHAVRYDQDPADLFARCLTSVGAVATADQTEEGKNTNKQEPRISVGFHAR